ncbi:MAG TPA: hypothetical protein VLM75_11350 [Spirochaetota bacterium]|nr:hypothetical protein [Spirochaetota bacterium]
MAKATSLLKAYLGNTIPANGGFIISSFFDNDSAYTIYEITSYVNVKDIYKSPDGLVFKTDGNRTHILVEPASFTQRFSEPVHREKGKSIPYRFSEMEVITGKKQEKIMVPIEPIMLYSSFTILDTVGENFSFVFHPTEDVYMAMRKFIADTMYNDCNLTKDECKRASELALSTIKKFTIWK